MVLMDFTSVPITDKPGVSVCIQDFVIVLEYLDEHGALVRRNIDFLCANDTNQNNKHDYHFVLQAWVHLFIKERINERFDILVVWSDGGPHHFKTRWCQLMWHCLSQLRFDEKPIEHHFFASMHGHSLADAHAAVIKRALKQEYKLSEMRRTTHHQEASFGPSTIVHVAAVLRARCQNTQVIVYDEIDRDNERRPDVSAIPRIKSYHCFAYMNGSCRAYHTSEFNPSYQPMEFEFEYKQA